MPATLSEVLSPKDAVALLLDEYFQFYTRGDIIWFHHIARDYDHFVRAKGWPAITRQKLGRLLTELGCKRGIDDLRASGRGRLRTIILPAKPKRKRSNVRAAA